MDHTKDPLKFDLQLFAEEVEELEPTGGAEGGSEGQAGVEEVGEGNTPEAGQANQEQFLEIDGKKYTWDDIKRLEDTRKNLEGYYYTRLNELRPYQELADWLKANPSAAQQLAQMQQGQVAQAGQEDYSDDPYMQKITGLESQIKQLLQFQEVERQRQADLQLQHEINELKGKYKDFDEKEVLMAAHQLGIGDLEKAYWAVQGPKLMQQIPKIKEEAIKEYVSKKASKQPPSLPPGGGWASGATKPVNFADARRAAMQRMMAIEREE